MKEKMTRIHQRFHAVLKLTVVAVLLLVHLNSASAGEIFVTDLIDGTGALPIAGNQAYTGQLGDDFTVNSDISITSIGVFDDNGDGSVGSLYWQLFNVGTGALLHSQEIAATGPRTPGSTVADNYLWEQTISAIDLFAGETYSAVAYGFDSVDKNFNTNFGLTTLDVVFNSADLTGYGGRYGSPFGTLPSAGAGNSASTQPYNFGAATFEYNAASIPEPSAVFLLGIGLIGLSLSRKRGSKAAESEVSPHNSLKTVAG